MYKFLWYFLSCGLLAVHTLSVHHLNENPNLTTTAGRVIVCAQTHLHKNLCLSTHARRCAS